MYKLNYLPKDNITEPIDIMEPRSFGLDISAIYTLAEFVPTATNKYSIKYKIEYGIV